MKQIATVGIVGFGVMGAAIGINAAMSGYRVIYKELDDECVKQMFERRVAIPLKKKVVDGKITQGEKESVLSMIRGTSDYKELAGCDLIIEAVVENSALKIEVFEALSQNCRRDAILVTNTSTFPVETLMQKVKGQERTAGLHYFFPANVNRLVEVIRQRNTSDQTYEALMEFAEKNGKIVICVEDFPGFAINPLFISSYMVLDSFFEEGRLNATGLDMISKETLGLKYGIMWTQNAVGLATCYHAAVSMNSFLADSDMGYPPVPPSLKKKFERLETWNLEDGTILEDRKERRYVAERLLGAVFAVSAHLMEREVVSPKDLEIGICTALAWPKGPLTLMNETGMPETSRLIRLAVAAGYFRMPTRFTEGVPPEWVF